MTVRGNKVLYIYGNINLNTAPMLQAYLHAHESILLGTRTDPIINIFSLVFHCWTNIRTILVINPSVCTPSYSLNIGASRKNHVMSIYFTGWVTMTQNLASRD